LCCKFIVPLKPLLWSINHCPAIDDAATAFDAFQVAVSPLFALTFPLIILLPFWVKVPL